MKKFITAAIAATISLSSASCAFAQQTTESVDSNGMEIPTVYFIKDITPENLVKIYKALGSEAHGRVGVKISTGESQQTNYLDPNLMKPLVQSLNGTFIECNTAYKGVRMDTKDHEKAIKERGFLEVAPVDIMDAEGEIKLPVSNGYHLPYDIVGKDFDNYDYMLVLSHFKGHQMGGFGGALKNISIGIASTDGKTFIHTAGKTANHEELWGNLPEQDDFTESMADACQGVVNHIGKRNVAYINVANKLSVDCDCNAHPEAPQMGDLGIFASLDPVAVDRACVDAVYNSTDPGKVHLIERIESRKGTHILDAAEHNGLGTQKYRLVVIE